MEAVKIVCFATLAAVTYGILHDQITAHVCLEYFTIAHPKVFPTESPFLLAIGWGVIATWWVGLPLGLLLAFAARIGRNAKLGLAQVRRPIIYLMAFSGCAALLSGVIGASLVTTHVMDLGYWGDLIPRQHWSAFAFDLWAHSASYFFGALGGLFLVALTFKRRLDA